MNKPFLKVITAVIIALSWAVGAYFAIIIWQFNRPPFPLSRLASLHSGMTTNVVRQLLGPPESIYVRTNDAAQPFVHWAYRRAGSWPIVYVYFHPDGTFERHRYDH